MNMCFVNCYFGWIGWTEYRLGVLMMCSKVSNNRFVESKTQKCFYKLSNELSRSSESFSRTFMSHLPPISNPLGHPCLNIMQIPSLQNVCSHQYSNIILTSLIQQIHPRTCIIKVLTATQQKSNFFHHPSTLDPTYGDLHVIWMYTDQFVSCHTKSYKHTIICRDVT